MKHRLILLISPLLILPLIFFYECRSNKYIPDVCFQTNVLPIFISKCTTGGCHTGSGKDDEGRSDLTNYEGIMRQVKPYYPLFSEVYTKCSGISPEMPPKSSAKLTTTELEYIKYWIHTGAKNTSNCDGKACDSTNLSFTNRIMPILNTWCVGCHNATTAGGGFDFTSYDGVVACIAPDNRLSGSIHKLTGYSAMPKDGNMSDCEIKVIQKWIDTNYPNN